MATEGHGNGHRNGNGHGEGDDGPDDPLRRRVAEQREVVRRTAAELEDRLRDAGHEVREKIETARETVAEVREKMHVVGDKMHDVTGFMQRHRYAVIGGSLAAGVLLGMRRARRERREVEQQVRYVVAAAEPAKKASLIGSLFGAALAFAAKQGMSYVSERLQGGHAEEETPPYGRYLPPPQRAPLDH